MSALASLAERRALARAETLRQWLVSESAKARAAASDPNLLHASIAEFVLHRGKAFETGHLSDSERRSAHRIVRWCRAEHDGFRVGQPFWNARRAIELDVLDQFHYVEGFVLEEAETVPRAHAWLSTITTDLVVDFTGRERRQQRRRRYPPMVLGEFSERSYFGVALPREFVNARGQSSLTDEPR